MLNNIDKWVPTITGCVSLCTACIYLYNAIGNCWKKSTYSRFKLYDYRKTYDTEKNELSIMGQKKKKEIKGKPKKIYLVFDFDTINNKSKTSMDLNIYRNVECEFDGLEVFISYIIYNYTPENTHILLRISSCGGAAYKYERMYTTMLRLQKHKFSTIAFIDDYCASGGYMLACACDKIIATSTSKIGSVGVVMKHQNYKGLFDKIGILEKSIKTARAKGFDNFNGCDEIDDQYAIAKEEIDYILNMFKTIVSNSRKNVNMNLVTEAKVYYGDDALKHGFIDEISNIDDYLLDLSKNEENGIYHVIINKYEKKTGLIAEIIDNIMMSHLGSMFQTQSLKCLTKLHMFVPQMRYRCI